MSAAEGAEALGMDEPAVVEVIARLTARDFDKSMPSDLDPGARQDVYKPVVDGRALREIHAGYARGVVAHQLQGQ